MSSSSPWHHLYNTTVWVKGRRQYLAQHPLCVYCERRGRVTAAKVVDHKKPHKGDIQLFYDRTNWQGLCINCHDSVKKAEEHGRMILGCGADGQPLDSNHPWN